MSNHDRTIELPVDDAEAVKRLTRELRAAQHRLAESRRANALSAYRLTPVAHA